LYTIAYNIKIDRGGHGLELLITLPQLLKQFAHLFRHPTVLVVKSHGTAMAVAIFSCDML
jgi:capsular polysaccharide biosynthesis protein